MPIEDGDGDGDRDIGEIPLSDEIELAEEADIGDTGSKECSSSVSLTTLRLRLRKPAIRLEDLAVRLELGCSSAVSSVPAGVLLLLFDPFRPSEFQLFLLPFAAVFRGETSSCIGLASLLKEKIRSRGFVVGPSRGEARLDSLSEWEENVEEREIGHRD